MTTRDAGRQAEDTALQYLEKKGYRLVARNYEARTGEIDLVVSQNDTLVFVEVRLRNHPDYGSGADSVTRQKQRRLIQTAQRFLQDNGTSAWDSYRFDVISIDGRVDWIPGAFTLD